MLKSSLCNFIDAYILVKGTITVPNTAATAAAANNDNKNLLFKNCTTLHKRNKLYTSRQCLRH